MTFLHPLSLSLGQSLDEAHTVFGQVTEGLDVLEKINHAYCDREGNPLQVIRIRHTVVLDDPLPDPKGFPAEPPPSPPLSVLLDKVEAGEDLDADTRGKVRAFLLL